MGGVVAIFKKALQNVFPGSIAFFDFMVLLLSLLGDKSFNG